MKTFSLVLLISFAVAQVHNAKDLDAVQAIKTTVKSNRVVPLAGRSPRILASQTATRGQFPHQAAIFIDASGFCGGSLISTEWVLTAAQCVDGFSEWDIYLGAQDLTVDEEGRVVVSATTAIWHQNYLAFGYQVYDIAVLGLASAVATSDYIQPVNLPTRSQVGELFNDENVTLSGWGETSVDGDISSTLQYGNLRVIENGQCATDFSNAIRSVICCEGYGDVELCFGDMGGPLVLGSVGNYTQLGIASFVSYLGCQDNLPDGFTRVTEFLDWISNNTGIAIA